jgi:hypothetical protein
MSIRHWIWSRNGLKQIALCLLGYHDTFVYVSVDGECNCCRWCLKKMKI